MKFLSLLPLLAFPCNGSPDEDVVQLIERKDHIESLAREPMAVEHPSGVLFLAGFGSQVTGTDWTAPPPLWRSDDRGKTWRRVDVGSSENGAQGNSDVDLAVGPDGTIYFITMGFNRATRRGTHIAMGVSHDVGATWRWQFLSRNDLDDRPWVAVSPDNFAHVIWNDGKGVRHVVSSDSGRTWQERQRVHDKGGSSHLAVGEGGLVAVRTGPLSAAGQVFNEGVDLIAVSTDGGQSWTRHPTPGDITWDPSMSDPNLVPRWVEPLAWGPDGTLYHLWSEGEAVSLGLSRDFGASWEKRIVAHEDGKAFFPFLASNDIGNLAATWFVLRDQEVSARLAVIQPHGKELRVCIATPFTPLSWQDTTDVRKQDTAGEYLPTVWLKNGDIGVASPIQDAHEKRYGFSWWVFRADR